MSTAMATMALSLSLHVALVPLGLALGKFPGILGAMILRSKIRFSVLTLLFGLSVSPVYAQTQRSILVDPLDDNASEMGCTLREAIDVANANLAEALGCSSSETGSGYPVRYTLLVPAMTYTIATDSIEDANLFGDLDIASMLTLLGQGVGQTIIDGGGKDRVFHVASGFSLTVRDLTVQNGQSAGLLNEGGRLELENTAVLNNRGYDGGGIRSVSGQLILNGALVANNVASNTGGGLYVAGGADPVMLRNVIVSDNQALRAGGVYSESAIMIKDSSVVGNIALQRAGGLWLFPPSAEIVNVEISGNEAGTDGGGLLINGRADVGILGSTIADNHAEGEGGGIRRGTIEAARLSVANSTIARNVATGRGGGFSGGGALLTHVTIIGNHSDTGGGGISGEDGQFRIKATLIANNTSSIEGLGDCLGIFNTDGSNLIRAADGCLTVIPQGAPNRNGDFVGTLATPTEPLLLEVSPPHPVASPGPNSIALDAVPSGQCRFRSAPGNPAFSDAQLVVFDQRGEPRDSRCDIGAIEQQVLFSDGFDEQ